MKKGIKDLIRLIIPIGIGISAMPIIVPLLEIGLRSLAELITLSVETQSVLGKSILLGMTVLVSYYLIKVVISIGFFVLSIIQESFGIEGEED